MSEDPGETGETGGQGNDPGSDPTSDPDQTPATRVQNQDVSQVNAADIQFVVPNGVLTPSFSDTASQPTDSAPKTYDGYFDSAANVFTANPPQPDAATPSAPTGTGNDLQPFPSQTGSSSGSSPVATTNSAVPPNQLSSTAGDGHWVSHPPPASETPAQTVQATIDGKTATWAVTTTTTPDGRVLLWYGNDSKEVGAVGKFFVVETSAPISTPQLPPSPPPTLLQPPAAIPVQPQSAPPPPSLPIGPGASPSPLSNWDRAFDRNPNVAQLPQIPPYRPLNTTTAFPLPNAPFGAMPSSIAPSTSSPTSRTGAPPDNRGTSTNSGGIPLWQALGRPDLWPKTVDPGAIAAFNAGVSKHAVPLVGAAASAAAASLLLGGSGAYDVGAGLLSEQVELFATSLPRSTSWQDAPRRGSPNSAWLSRESASEVPAERRWASAPHALQATPPLASVASNAPHKFTTP